MKPLVVLSLFDGMSCGQIALDRLGIPVKKYYASEIDKYAIEITQKNYPNTIQMGDVTKIKRSDIPEDVDLIQAGSPCQGFSFSGDQLAFDDPRSALFFEFIRIQEEFKPKYFLLENVPMKREFEDVISYMTKQYPHTINASLVSAQNRKRLFWTNIPLKTKQPVDQGIVLRDILEQDLDPEKYKISDMLINRVLNEPRGAGYFYDDESEKIGTLIAGYHKNPTDGCYIQDKTTYKKRQNLKELDEKSNPLMAGNNHMGFGTNGATVIPDPSRPKMVGFADGINGHDILKRVYDQDGKSPTLSTCGGGNTEPKVGIKKAVGGKIVGRAFDEDGKRKDHLGSVAGQTTQMLESRSDEKSNTLTTAQKDTVVGIEDEEWTWRKLTPLECERLQSVDDNYTEGVSNTQRYRMLGNGWNCKVIEFIYENLLEEPDPLEPDLVYKQVGLFD